MSDISITQHLDAFRNLARRHLEKGSVDGLAALKQTLEMDDKTFAELLNPCSSRKRQPFNHRNSRQIQLMTS